MAPSLGRFSPSSDIKVYSISLRMDFFGSLNQSLHRGIAKTWAGIHPADPRLESRMWRKHRWAFGSESKEGQMRPQQQFRQGKLLAAEELLISQQPGDLCETNARRQD